MSELITAIRQAVKSMIKPDLLLGKVKKFHADDWTIDVELNNGAKVEKVTIKSVLNGIDSGIFIEPEIDSCVLCGLTDGKIENLSVLVFSEIKNIRYSPSEKILLRSDEFGGILKAEAVQANLDMLKNAITTIKNALPSAFSSVGAGTAANGPAGASSFTLATSSININFQDMENPNVKHG